MFVIKSQYSNNYQASLLDKISRLKSIKEPKIILVGNSNVSYGIDSKLLQDEFNMPVVNMGLHGGVGNAFNENVAKINICKDDILIVCHSDYSDEDEITAPELVLITFDCNKEVLPAFRMKDYKKLIKAYPNYLKKSFMLWITNTGNLDTGGSYSRNAFNKYGDVAFKPKSEQITDYTYYKDRSKKIPKINDICTNRLNHLNEFCIQKGAKMVIAGFPIIYGKYSEFSEEDINVFQKKLKEKLNSKVISDFTNYMYQYEYFYNSSLHLNEKGTQKRTKQLISDIRNAKIIENKTAK